MVEEARGKEKMNQISPAGREDLRNQPVAIGGLSNSLRDAFLLLQQRRRSPRLSDGRRRYSPTTAAVLTVTPPRRLAADL